MDGQTHLVVIPTVFETVAVQAMEADLYNVNVINQVFGLIQDAQVKHQVVEQQAQALVAADVAVVALAAWVQC